MIVCRFLVDRDEIEGVCRLKKITFGEKLIGSAKRNLALYNEEYDSSKTHISDVLSVFSEDILAEVAVFPSQVRMGAVNCERKRILLSSARRQKGMRMALVAHELSHIAMYPRRKAGTIGRLVDEAISYLVENETLWRISGRPYFTSWKKSVLDRYHKVAFDAAESCIKEWEGSLARKDISALLTRLSKLLPDDKRSYKLREFLD